MATGWGIDGWGDTTWGGSQDFVTGVLASGVVGTVSNGGVVVTLTGVSATGEVENVTETNNPTESGVIATGQVGTVGIFYWSLIDDNETPNWALINDNETPNWQNVIMTV